MEDKEWLAEIDRAIAAMPPITQFDQWDGSVDVWLGRVVAVLERFLTPSGAAELNVFCKAIEAGSWATVDRMTALRGTLRLLHTIRTKLLMRTGGTGTVAIDQGMYFKYFDALREVVQTATSDIFFIDPYLDEEILSKFCVFARPEVSVRLLGERYASRLQPAAESFNKERGGTSLRKTDKVHDRYLFVDKAKCYLSGASFKDGPKYAPSIVTEIVDGAAGLLALYETIWDKADRLL